MHINNEHIHAYNYNPQLMCAHTVKVKMKLRLIGHRQCKISTTDMNGLSVQDSGIVIANA